MTDSNNSASSSDPKQVKRNFMYPLSRFYGHFTPEQLAFNANLQEFAQRVSMLCGLETGGKLSPEQTYQEIKSLWQNLTESKKQLLDSLPPDPPKLPPDT